jgi:UDP-N-acetylmuramate--alanine ligase
MNSIPYTNNRFHSPRLDGAGIHQAMDAIRVVYFVGIGGIGMSALARYFNAKGVSVSGYDKTPTPLTKLLESEGISIHYHEDVTLIPKQVDLVVYTPAIPAAHAELVFYQEHGYKVVKRSDVLQLITESSFNICVAGTHGKTTISTMIAHILRHTGYGCNAFLGGIAANYGTNFWSSEKNICVVEADEYDRSFLKLSPDVAVITAIDPDHLDIYGTPEEVEKAFVAFSHRLKPGGCLVSKYGLSKTNELHGDVKMTYAYEHYQADVHAADVRVHNGSYWFDVIAKDWILTDVVLHMGGLHNIENVTAAIAVAKHLGIDDRLIKDAVAEFRGVKRRFEFIVREDEHVLIDDYAHHPEELKALITGVKSLYKEKLTIIFQPHLFTRTRDLAETFAASLDLADEVILLPIYPARELPIEGVSSEMIAAKMAISAVSVLTKDEMLDWMKQQQPSLVVMAGAGDIDALVLPVKEILMSV